MDYIWDVLVKAKNEEIDLKEISFKLASSYSPYMELSNEELNFNEISGGIEINPYYRFSEIFKDLFNPNYSEYQELREVLLDIIVHFLGQIDLQQGMDKIEYHKSFIYDEIKTGYFGARVKEGIKFFNPYEINILLRNFYKFYLSGDYIYYLKDTTKKIFEGSILYLNQEGINEILAYINDYSNEENLMKLKVIEDLFLPINFKLTTYWENHFGVIDVEETMQVGKISIY
ncbi:iron-dependent peroxidase [Orenia marismortui]|uniref:Iron-dependent peroxidase n=1 Tax=Orenia marismortui TaxID=46469 RepID=A0A4R8HFT6_9FIRM|nr:iron-dependent peroxidase [Orenia marismortui]TDX58975.1 hypothetical protein C7959_102113 [Orenia marismortui]